MAFIPYYILILAVTIIVDYIAGIYIEKSEGKKRKLFLTVSICVNVGFLGFFKYFNFFNSNLASLAQLIHWNYPIENLSIILPIGLSFHTFQAMSYTIEVFRGNQKAEKKFGIFALYVMFYPQLVAGPIERPQNLLHQFYEKHELDYIRITNGLKLMLWGLFKKVVIADRLAVIVSKVYDSPTEFTGVSLIVATLAFAFQIYCDFSGYSDIAIGAAQVMGFKLMDNFNRPYFAKSISEFWKRWHISLSTWFRDYLYIPLGGNKLGKWRWQFNLFITFLVSGLWHGANWNFVIWGALNGFYLIFAIWTYDVRKRLADISGLSSFPVFHKYLQVAVTFSLTCFAWVFFRARNATDAFYIIRHMFSGIRNQGLSKLYNSIMGLGLEKTEIAIAILAILFMEIIHLIQRHGSIRAMLENRPLWVRWTLYYAMIYSLILFGYYNSNAFIYFQF